MEGEKQRQKLKCFPTTLPYSQAQSLSLIPDSSASPSPDQHRGMRNEGLWSDHNSSSPLLLPSHTFPLLRCGISKGCSASGWTCSTVESSPHGPQFLQRICTCSGLGSSMGCSVDICSRVVLSTGCRQIPAPPWSL